MSTLQSVIVITELQGKALEALQELVVLPSSQSFSVHLLKIDFEGRTYYGCWSSGKIRDKQPFLTPVGMASLEALMSYPVDGMPQPILCELKLGKVPLRQFIENVLRQSPNNAKICFIGDIAGKLDGELVGAFNVQVGSFR